MQSLKEAEEHHRYHTARSSESIGYTTFGHLAQIVIARWQDFEDLFPDQAWIVSRFKDMEMSRNIIMHTGILAPIEIDRVESIARDWVRQVG
ncbi:Swt1 family HEPN domain-containing protein [Bradyrhizobium yuanmingense]|uniref:Swt1 family HEPN domain-containing protein n=1 Tax=Bradyrhizobium yuanmingense TaxID=108015 RepID=UPI0023BA1F6A|nr:Swt1 family HEPN domain-containing protein [Bradyrhizobium yuanmingense]MDF0522032.1 Swt1 family HEPN domain-containing protein [Bradyrhizobium yuanmingense]